MRLPSDKTVRSIVMKDTSVPSRGAWSRLDGMDIVWSSYRMIRKVIPLLQSPFMQQHVHRSIDA